MTHPSSRRSATLPRPVDNPVDNGPVPIADVLPHLAKACPNCGADPGQFCTTATGIPMPTQTHRARPRPRKAPRKRTPRAPVPQHLQGVSEAEFSREVVKVARAAGWRVMHVSAARSGDQWTTPTSVRGWPDWTLWRPGKGGLLFREMKAERGTVSDKQAAVIESLRAAGCDAGVWRPSDWDAIVDTLGADARLPSTGAEGS